MLDTVTITGADDNTPVSALVDLSAEFPFVEWAILVSGKQEGSFRFPARKWIDNFVATVPAAMDVSMHMCGGWVRRLLAGSLDWDELPASLVERTSRIQINTHAEPHVSTTGLFETLGDAAGVQWIFQLDGINDHLLEFALHRQISAVGLFDQSHGAGVLPSEWQESKTYRGYAGGLGPENVVEQIGKIQQVATGNFWIDMEGRVRTHERLDLAKVRKVLELCAPLVDQ